MNSLRFTTLLICLAAPFNPASGQSTTAPIIVSESKQFVINPDQGSTRTHIPAGTHYVNPDRPDKPDPDDRDEREDREPRSPPRDDPDDDGDSPGTRTDKPSPTVPASPIPAPVPENTPSVRDLANRGGSLLQRSPTGFAALPESFSADFDDQNDDPDMEYEPCELLTLSTTMSEAQALEQQFLAGDIRIRRRVALPNLDVVLSSFCVSDNEKAETVLQSFGEQQPTLPVALNHRYQLAAKRDYYAESIGWREDLRSCGISRRIGLIDTAVDTEHHVFRESSVTTKNLLSAGTRSADQEHGTAVASVLVGASGETPGLVGRADLMAVNVFRVRDGGIVDTNAELLIRAIDWLLGQNVEMINMSIAGPENATLEFAVNAVFNYGILVVAAGGNGNPNPAFPAAYPDVIAVTAVDARARIHVATNQGDYIDFAAPGVDLYLAAPKDRAKFYTGTSFATPFVTAALAALKTAYPGADTSSLVKQLSARAIDLGTAGRDPVFGWGLVQAPVECTSVAVRQ